MMTDCTRFVDMMEQNPKSIYDLLQVTPDDMDSESDSEGSYHPLRECNMFHLWEDGVVLEEGIEDDAYLIPRTPKE